MISASSKGYLGCSYQDGSVGYGRYKKSVWLARCGSNSKIRQWTSTQWWSTCLSLLLATWRFCHLPLTWYSNIGVYDQNFLLRFLMKRFLQIGINASFRAWCGFATPFHYRRRGRSGYASGPFWICRPMKSWTFQQPPRPGWEECGSSSPRDTALSRSRFPASSSRGWPRKGRDGP